MKPTSSRKRQAGMSLVEVLTAILIFSIGIVGLLSLQSRAIQFSMGAEDTNRAALLANELAAEMWARKSVVLDAGVITAWQGRVALLVHPDGSPASGLPNGRGDVTVTGNVAEITVEWRPQQEAPGNTNRFVTQVLIPE